MKKRRWYLSTMQVSSFHEPIEEHIESTDPHGPFVKEELVENDTTIQSLWYYTKSCVPIVKEEPVELEAVHDTLSSTCIQEAVHDTLSSTCIQEAVQNTLSSTCIQQHMKTMNGISDGRVNQDTVYVVSKVLTGSEQFISEPSLEIVAEKPFSLCPAISSFDIKEKQSQRTELHTELHESFAKETMAEQVHLKHYHDYIATSPLEEWTQNYCMDLCGIRIKGEPEETVTVVDTVPPNTWESQALQMTDRKQSSQTLPNNQDIHIGNNQTLQDKVRTMATRSVSQAENPQFIILNSDEKESLIELSSKPSPVEIFKNIYDLKMECKDEFSLEEKTERVCAFMHSSERQSVIVPSPAPVPVGIVKNYFNSEKFGEPWVRPVAKFFPVDKERKVNPIETDQLLRNLRRKEMKDKRRNDMLLNMHMKYLKNNIFKKKALMEMQLQQEIKLELDGKRTAQQTFHPLDLPPPLIRRSQRVKSNRVYKT